MVCLTNFGLAFGKFIDYFLFAWEVLSRIPISDIFLNILKVSILKTPTLAFVLISEGLEILLGGDLCFIISYCIVRGSLAHIR